MNCSMIDWKSFIIYTNKSMDIIKMELNSSFDSILNGLDELRLESQRQIELKLQDHIVFIAEEQRKISRMHRQLSIAYELLEYRPFNSSNNFKKNNKIFYLILFGILIGMLYERFIRLRFHSMKGAPIHL